MIQYNRLEASGARKPASYVSAHASVTTHKEFTIPAGANIVVLNGTAAFHFLFGANPVAAVPTDDDTGGSCALINPSTPIESRTFQCVPGQKISVVAAAASTITAEFYKL